jgi:hypothetical protein
MTDISKDDMHSKFDELLTEVLRKYSKKSEDPLSSSIHCFLNITAIRDHNWFLTTRSCKTKWLWVQRKENIDIGMNESARECSSARRWVKAGNLSSAQRWQIPASTILWRTNNQISTARHQKFETDWLPQ